MTLKDQLQSALGNTYAIDRELGGGAMSRVFVATELALKRRVVVKALPDEMRSGMSSERFQREIAVSASLQHAHIVPVLSAGDARGMPYFTMPYIEGESLRTYLAQKGAPSIADAVRMLREVASALAYAHERGVVHRDIKPDNVLVSGGATMVTDFGIAKAIMLSRTTSMDATAHPQTAITQAGIALGTPSYMAPEQAAGDPGLDHRVDIYAFGCLAYEVLTGQPPFPKSTIQAVLAAHLTETPKRVSDIRADVPPALADLVARCLAKDPKDRPQQARDVVAALDAIPLTISGAQATASKRPVGARVMIPAAVVLVMLGAFYVLRGPSPSRSAPASLAVLPFANVGGDSAQDYLADGMTDELTTAIGKLAGVQVASRSAAYHYRGRDLDLKKVGGALGVSYVVQGSIRREGSRLRVSTQLTNTTSGQEAWSETYDRDAADVFSVQDDITNAIASALAPKLATSDHRSPTTDHPASQGTRDPEAYDWYLRGEYALGRRGAGVNLATEDFQRAIAKDSMFARAYSGLAAALSLFPYFTNTPTQAVYDRIVVAARRAIAIDPSLAEAHRSLGLAYAERFQIDLATEELQRAVALEPANVEASIQYGRHLTHNGRLQEALTEFRRAKALDPASAVASSWVSYLLWLTGDMPAALVENQRALELDSTNGTANRFGAEIHLAAGQITEARRLADRLPPAADWPGIRAYVYARSGDREIARQTIARLQAAHPQPWMAQSVIAMAKLGLGDTTGALTAFERATDAEEIWPVDQPLPDPMYDGLRSNARFLAAARRAHLEPTALTARGR